MMWHTSELTSEPSILSFLQTDRFYSAYAIGDLEPGLFEQCTWVGAERAGEMQALVLHFRGLVPPALLLMGDTVGLRSILENASRPDEVYLTCRPEHLPMVREFYTWDEPTPMWRMVLRPERPAPGEGECTRLLPADADRLSSLFTHGGGGAFSPAQMVQGVFYGVQSGDQIVPVAGTHLVSRTYGVAAIGNVFTHPDWRRRGYGMACTSAVVAELLEQGIQDIVLNVGQDNSAAIRMYERLGFQRYCPFLEGVTAG